MGYISPICQEASHGGISTKFCTAVEVMDVITCDNFFGDLLSDVNSVRGQKWRVAILSHWLLTLC